MRADFYKDLGVDRSAGEDEIKRAYRKLAGKYHPDKNPGDAQAEERFKRINRAHSVLSDKKRRQLYDEFGEAGLREGFNPDMARGFGRNAAGSSGGFGGAVNLEDLFGGAAGSAGAGGIGDLFGEMFGGGRRGRARGPRRGADVGGEVEVDFVSAIRGVSVKVGVPGRGEDVTVRIPEGAGDGDKVRVAGHGQPGENGGAAGDVLLTIRVRPHPVFERKGLDLHVDLPISVSEAYHGAKVQVPTPTGSVNLKVAAGTQSGQVARLKGRGVKRQTKVGDLFVRYLIKLPEKQSKELTKSVDALGSATDVAELRSKIVL